MDIKTIHIALRGVSAWRELMTTELMARVLALLDTISDEWGEAALEQYTEIFYLLRREGCAGLGDWLDTHLRYDEAPYPLLVERGGSDPALEGAARRDVEVFSALARLSCGALLEAVGALLGEEYRPVLNALPRWTEGAPFDFEALTAFWRTHGAGLFARYRAFVWQDGVLEPVAEPDAPDDRELIGYDAQRAAVIANTRAMLDGHTVNNVLLYGDCGTGKSAAVKSLLTVEGFDDLRIIELQKDGLGNMSALIRQLKGRRQKFILFIDDLAFDQDDRTYSLLKTILEGGLEPRPANIVIYATSNRRNLVRQTFSDRAGDEVDCAETIQEKTALADRFGLRIAFLPLNKAEFLHMVDALAALEGITVEREALHAGAMQWELRHAGRTPRTAKQFIASLKVDG